MNSRTRGGSGNATEFLASLPEDLRRGAASSIELNTPQGRFILSSLFAGGISEKSDHNSALFACEWLVK